MNKDEAYPPMPIGTRHLTEEELEELIQEIELEGGEKQWKTALIAEKKKR